MPDPISSNSLKSDVHACFTDPQIGIKESLAIPLQLPGPANPNSATAPLTPEQQALLDHYRQADAAFWQAHDAYRQALAAQSKARAACRAAGINLAEHI